MLNAVLPWMKHVNRSSELDINNDDHSRVIICYARHSTVFQGALGQHSVRSAGLVTNIGLIILSYIGQCSCYIYIYTYIYIEHCSCMYK